MVEFIGGHVANMDATPFTRTLSKLNGGNPKSTILTYELPDTANADYAIVAAVPVDAVLKSIKFASDDLGTAGTVDIGFYKRNANGSYTAVSAAAIANNIDVNSAAVALTEYRFSVKGIETAQQTMWELAGLSARPSYGDLYIGLTTDTGTTTSGTVTMHIEYLV